MSDRELLSVRGMWKAFPGVQALADVSLDLRAGQVHALMGENGAGKSTLARILAGLERPDGGTVELAGREVRLGRPHEALRQGIAMIPQELLPLTEMAVAENIFLGHEPCRRGGWVDRRRMEADASALLARLRADIDPGRRMGELSVGQRQTVEIAKALAHRARVIVMDEPTSSLSAHETEALFRVIGELTRDGACVLYVSHKLDEVFALSQTVTVLRDGRHVGTEPTASLTEARLISMMVGRSLDLAPRGPHAAADDRSREIALEVHGLGRQGTFSDVSFHVARGEILGVAGLVGAGRTDVLSAIFGLAPAEAGEIRVAGLAVRIRSPRDAMRCGIALVSEDRARLGLVPTMSVQHNLTLSDLGRCCRAGFIDGRREAGLADEQIRRFGIRLADRRQPVRSLSGGNQQKVVLAKALLAGPDVVLLDEPTRGIDVAAKAEIHALVRALADEGKAVVLVSSELSELLALSDRILVMREGAVTAEIDAADATQEKILSHAVKA